MNNAKAEHRAAQGHPGPAQSRSNAHATDRPGDEIRDFFKRGDRGLYEGGAADRSSASIPTWDLPETRAQIVRTPKQQARRVAMMQVVGTIVAGCLVLLVTAARVKAGGASEKQPVDSRQVSSQPVVLSLAKSNTQFAQHAKAVPAPAAAPTAIQSVPTAANAASNTIAAVTAPVNAAPVVVREVAAFSPVSPASRALPAVSKVATGDLLTHSNAKVAPVSAARAKPVQYAEPVRSPSVAPPSHASAPKRAVAAFPED